MKKPVLMMTVLLSACAAEPVPVIVAEPAPVIEETSVVVESEPVIQPALVESLMGLMPYEVISLMGSPNLVRRDGLAQVMLFENDTCVLDIVFYADSIEDPYKVQHISARTRRGQKSDHQQCLTHIKPEGFH